MLIQATFTELSDPISRPHATADNDLMASAVLKALIFDLDGTLYRHGPLRRAVLYRLLRTYLTSPLQGLRVLRALQSYRSAQEVLRRSQPDYSDIAAAQLDLASVQLGVCRERIASYVSRWMEQEPLPLLAGFMRKGIVNMLAAAKKGGLKLAICSDYPAERKLAAMNIRGLFDVVVTAQDQEVQRFKPDPRGLEVVLQKLAVEKTEALYIGDRAEVDAAAAFRAGIPYFILSPGQHLDTLTKQLNLRAAAYAEHCRREL
jgi:FMN phosphatase YigB (HAD superfamily)